MGMAKMCIRDRVDLIGQKRRDNLADEIELLGAGREFDLDAVRNGTLSPVFFGSALTNFGVEPFLEGFLRMTTAPLSRESLSLIHISLWKSYKCDRE